MGAKTLGAAAGGWLVLLAAAILNGGFREAVLVPRVGETAGHAWSTAILIAFIALVVPLLVRRPLARLSLRGLWGVGLAWLGATVSFELIFGRYVLGTPWTDLLAAYDLAKGNLWMLVPLAMLVAPAVSRLAQESIARRRRARAGSA